MPQVSTLGCTSGRTNRRVDTAMRARQDFHLMWIATDLRSTLLSIFCLWRVTMKSCNALKAYQLLIYYFYYRNYNGITSKNRPSTQNWYYHLVDYMKHHKFYSYSSLISLIPCKIIWNIFFFTCNFLPLLLGNYYV